MPRFPQTTPVVVLLLALTSWGRPDSTASPTGDSPSSAGGGAKVGAIEMPAVESAAADTAPASEEEPLMLEEVEASADPASSSTEQPPPDTLPPLEREPKVIEFAEATYPPALLEAGEEGTVLLDVLVSDSGTVDSVAVAEGTHPALDTAAMAALRRFRFSPGMAGGQAVPVLIQYRYRFSVREVLAQKLERYVNFTGRLLERGTKKPITDAMVVITFIDTLSDTTLGVPFDAYLERIAAFDGQYLEEDRLVTITDSTGRFAFYSLPACTIEVAMPLPGYEEFRDRERIRPDEQTEVTYRLRRLSYSDYEIVVYAQAEEKEVSRRQLTINEVKRIPGLGGDAVKVVQAMPGVARPRFGGGAVVVRGAPTWDSQFYLDGILIPQIYHFGGLKSTYNSDGLAGVDFYPGGFGTRYGDGIAGVIELRGRSAKRDRWHGSADLSTLDGSFFIEGPINERLSLLASARRSFIGDIIGWYIENSSRDFPFTVSPFYWDYLTRIDYHPDDRHALSLTAFGSRDSLYFFFPKVPGGSSEVSDKTDELGSSITFHLASVGWEWKPGDIVTNSLRYGFTYSAQRSSAFGFFKMNVTSLASQVRNELSLEPTEKLRLNLGADLVFFPTDILLTTIDNNTGAILRDTIENQLYGDVAGYANLEWRPTEELLIIPGVRYDLYPELEHNGSMIPEFRDYDFQNATRFSGDPSLRLTARYQFVENHTAKGAIGTYNQAPEPMGMVTHEQWGEPTLATTKAAHYVLGYEWQLTDLIHLDLQGYINRQWDIPRFTHPDELEGGEDVGDLWKGDQRGRMRGVELMLRHDQGDRFFGWLSYTLSRSERYDKQEQRWVLYDNDETHNVQLLGSWRLPRDWDVGFRLRYVTGKPTTPVLGKRFIENENTIGFQPHFRPIMGPENIFRLDPFFQLDLRADKKFVFDKWILSAYLDIQNISYFLYKSPEFEIWDDFYDEKTTIPMVIMPAIGLKAEF